MWFRLKRLYRHPSFYRDFEGSKNGKDFRNCTDDTRQALEGLKKEGITGLVLDLRNNGGGSLTDAVDTAGLFIKSGPVVQVKNSSGVKRVLSDENPAAALQDYERAVIIGGRHTHGKGTVQTLVDMNENIPALHLRSYQDLGALKVTIQKFYRVTGGSTQYKGVESDIALPSLFQYLKSGEQYSEYSLPWDQVESVPFVRYSGKKIDLDRLKAASQVRVKSDPGFLAIDDEAKKAEERSKDTVVSLQLSEMKKKREEADLTRKTIGAHYRKYRVEKESGMDEEAENGASKVDDRLKWLEEVKDDPYIREASWVLADMEGGR